MNTIDIQVGSILALPLTTQYYPKTQPKLDAFND